MHSLGGSKQGSEKKYMYIYIYFENLLCVTHLILTDMNYFHFIP